MPYVIADFLSETHRISCKVEVTSTGLHGLLNDNNTSALEARDVYVSRIQQPAKIIANFEVITLNKATLSLAIVLRREDVGPQSTARRATPYPVLITTPAFEIKGNVEVPGKLDGSALLYGGTGKYMAIYQATAVATRFLEVPYSGEAMLVNRTLVETLAPLPKGKG
jgi:hypothetical protein